MNASPIAIALIQGYEKFEPEPYQDAGGVWTQGYGSTHNIDAKSLPITEQIAETWLKEDVTAVEAEINHLVTYPLNQNQFDALVSLCYNCGAAPLKGTLGRKLNAGDALGAAQEFDRWVHVGGAVNAGLVARRKAEKALFLSPCLIVNQGVTA